MNVCGIDEAGRGPVIGPLVICAFVIDEKKIPELKELGVKDSKLLSPHIREELAEKLKKMASDFSLSIIGVEEIDMAVNSDELNLNWLEAIKSAELIDDLKPDVAYLDCPSNNIESYVDYLKKTLKHPAKIIAEHRADSTYPVVSAASILAKVTRDAEIEKIKRKHKIQFGSGYPSDPFTVDFLKQNYNKYPIFRKSWASWKNVAQNNGQKKLGQF